LKGGADLTVENQSSIRFSVEESIWFQKGQEVSELLSMSLDPDIVIQEHDQYISVRGGLILAGEYHAQTDEDDSVVKRPEAVREVHEVKTREDGVYELKHKFPVDITIPKNRIQNLNDVYVTIESFDYELPQRGNLFLEAELSITGIYGDQNQGATLQAEREDETQDVQKVDEGQDEPVIQQETAPAPAAEQEETEQEKELVEPLMRGSFYEEEQEEDSSNDPFTPFVVEAKADIAEDEGDNVQESEESLNVYARQAPQLEFKSRVDVPVQNDKTYSNEEEYSTRDENALYLTKLFGTDQDASDTTRLRMCIVQKDETLEMIAERYEVQTQALIRVNNLDREHLAEGQILYIPALVGHRK
jgi:stage VI sporulation protein D